MNSVLLFAKNLARQFLKPIAKSRLSVLCQSGDSDVRKLAVAINDAISGKFDSGELHWIEKIEAIRQKLSRDNSVIEYTDYGAGKTDQGRTEEQMLEGVGSTFTVAEAAQPSKPRFWAGILFKIVRQFSPSNGLELGTCVGISGAYQAAAQMLNANGGRMITLEGSDSSAQLARENFKNLGLDNVEVVTGKFADTLGPVLERDMKFDYVFIDGHHDERATIDYYYQILPKLTENAVVIFDDISWSAGMKNAWAKISQDENVSISVNLRTIGICLLRPKGSDRFAAKVNLI